MRILVNALPLTGLMTGMPRYVRCLYGAMEEFPDLSITYFDGFRLIEKMPTQAEPQTWCAKTKNLWKLPDPCIVALSAVSWLRYENRLKRVLRRSSFDIYHETTFFPAAVKDIPVIYTLHDLSLLKYRDKHPRERLWFFDLFFQRRLPYASHILTVSEFIRVEMIEGLHLSPNVVTAIHEAPAPVFRTMPRTAVVETLRRYALPDEYILFVGTLEPRKNLSLLVKALAMSNRKIALVLAGWEGWGPKEWWSEVETLGLENRLYITGYLDENALACLYSGASAFVFPSFYEGFGLPVLEAMACGCPVICSNAASLPEVAGDAALFIDPGDPQDLSRALDKLLTDSELQATLVSRGYERVRQFSWQETAASTLQVFRKVLGKI